MAMFKIEDATRDNVPLLIGMMGSTGSGKTYSALRLAQGIQSLTPERPIVLIDADHGRSSIYGPPKFIYKRIKFPPPFNPDNYAQALIAARSARPSVVIIDQMTNEWRGKGGILEMVDTAEMKNKLAKWNQPRTEHWSFMSILEPLSTQCAIICCIRAEEKVELRGGDVVPAGWKPICETLFPYQMTFNFLVGHSKPGTLSLNRDLCRYVKTYEDAPAIPEGTIATPEIGAQLAAWAAGKDIPNTPTGEQA